MAGVKHDREPLTLVLGDHRSAITRFSEGDFYEQWPGGCADGTFFLPASARTLPVNELVLNSPVELWSGSIKLWRGWVTALVPTTDQGHEGWRVECGGWLDRAQHRKDFCRIYADNNYDQWHDYAPSQRYETNMDGELYVLAEPGNYTGGWMYRMWYWLHDGLGSSADTIYRVYFNYDVALGTGSWSAKLASSTTGPWPSATAWDWDTRLEWGFTSGSYADSTYEYLMSGTKAICFAFKCESTCTISANRYMRIWNLSVTPYYPVLSQPDYVAANIAETVVGIDASKIIRTTAGSPTLNCAYRHFTSPAEAILECADRVPNPVDWGFTIDDGFRFGVRADPPPAGETFTAFATHQGAPGVTLDLSTEAAEAADYYGLVYPIEDSATYPDGTNVVTWYPSTPPTWTDTKRTLTFSTEMQMTATEAANILSQLATYYSTNQTTGTVTCAPGSKLTTLAGTPIPPWQVRPGQWLKQRDADLPTGYISGRRLRQGDGGLEVEFTVGESLDAFLVRRGLVS